MKIDRVFMSGAVQERFERRCRRWDRANQFGDVIAAALIAAAGGAAVMLWLAWLCAGGL